MAVPLRKTSIEYPWVVFKGVGKLLAMRGAAPSRLGVHQTPKGSNPQSGGPE
jgi:hypothetical protein